ncbi:hypothetical protein [Nonlabens xiamenensis]|uniref:hypothetical protein n=1 Tax=Nonlabens xiamenensis TaxID=2341043 RepID=UPI000F60C3F3|nr:hypothetical protein [Nonlabens xiamenensis]
MNFKSLNKKKIWENYCSKHADFISELNVNEWVFHTENNFREFATYGFISSTKDTTFSFQNLNSQQYEKLFDFINNYFDMDMLYFTHFNDNI